MRNLGELGEKAFAWLCAQNGFNAHRPNEDRFGWDYLVEAPHPLSAHPRLLDSAPAHLEFRVQVKSTDGNTNGAAISLEHMLRLATLQMPVFFLFMAFDGGPEPVRTHLVHLGEDLISRTLKRARRLSASGRENLGSATLRVTFNSTHRLTLPLHEGFKLAFARFVPDGMAGYLVSKNEILKTVGFDNPRVFGNMTFKGVAASDVIDVLLGLKEDVAVERVKFTELRFGIPEDIGPKLQGEGRLSITEHHPLQVVLEVKQDPFSPPLEIEMEWYGLPNFFPEDQVKHRLVAPTFELILRPYADKLDLKRTVAGDTKLPLCRLKEFARLMRMLSHPPCKISLKKSGKPIYGCTVNGEANSDWDEVDRVASAAWELATRTGISAKVEVSLLELLKARVELKQIQLLLSGTSGQVTFQDARHYFPARRTGFLSTFDIVIGAFHIAGVFAVIGDPACREEGFAVESDRIHVLRAFATSATEWDESILDKLVELSANELEAEGVVAILPDRTADKAA